MSAAPVFTRDIFKVPEISIPNLRPDQTQAVKYMLFSKRCFNAMKTGQGKSLCALTVIDSAELIPALIVCPAGVKAQWAAEVVKWLGSKRSVSIISGETKKIEEGSTWVWSERTGSVEVGVNNLAADIVIVNYDILWTWAERLAKRGNRILIMDEGHRTKDEKTFFHKACKFLSHAVVPTNGYQYIYILTATPVVNRPADLIGQLKILGRLESLGGWVGFTKTFCDLKLKVLKLRSGKKTVRDISGSSNEQELWKRLKMICMYRPTEVQASSQVPPPTRIVIPVTLTNWTEYRKAETDLLNFIRDSVLNNRQFDLELRDINFYALRAKVLEKSGYLFPGEEEPLAHLNPLSEAEQRKELIHILKLDSARSAEKRAARAQALVKIGILRRLCGVGKIKAVVSWIKDASKNDGLQKSLIFGYHQEVQESLRTAFLGSAAQIDLELYKRRFETEPDMKVLPLSMGADSEGHNLAAAWNTFFPELSYTPKTHDQCEGRAHNRANNPHTINSYYFVCPNSIDEDVLAVLERKRKISSIITDGTEAKGILSGESLVEGELLDRVMKKVLNGS